MLLLHGHRTARVHRGQRAARPVRCQPYVLARSVTLNLGDGRAPIYATLSAVQPSRARVERVRASACPCARQNAFLISAAWGAEVNCSRGLLPSAELRI